MTLTRIGSLHWPITINKRIDTPDPASSGMLETLADPIETVADIQPTGPVVYFESINASDINGGSVGPITHRVFVRWITPNSPDAAFDLTYQITRTLDTPDGRSRTETFRIWRVLEVEGKLRFLQFDCELEQVVQV